jgi:molybdopterin-guanine dinucleotide biosynthesis adapter protein
MRRIHIVGRKNHGKTTLITDVIREFCRRGIRVGSVKHTPHRHELDLPGKDSFQHREAGASPVAVISKGLIAAFVSRKPDDDCYASLSPLFADCELVLVEGEIETAKPKIEVWRVDVGTPCLALERNDIQAVVSDHQPPVDVPVWRRDNVGELCDRLLALAR